MRNEAIFVITIILISALCLANNEDADPASAKTGDIMVVARGCKPPPYETGLKLILNRMPAGAERIIVTSYPDTLIDDEESMQKMWREYMLKFQSMLRSGCMLDTANGVVIIIPNVYYYNDYRVAVGITDSLGRYIFSDLPLGEYQLILDDSPPFNRVEEYERSNRRFAQRTDFPDFKINYPPDIEERLYPKGGSDELPLFGQTICIQGIIDSIRVAPDSISIAKIIMQLHNSSEIYRYKVGIWNSKFIPRDGQNAKDSDLLKDEGDRVLELNYAPSPFRYYKENHGIIIRKNEILIPVVIASDCDRNLLDNCGIKIVTTCGRREHITQYINPEQLACLQRRDCIIAIGAGPKLRPCVENEIRAVPYYGPESSNSINP